MKFRQPLQSEQSGLQLAPMIDIVFLLLIFFIVTWSYARFETELDISVPAAEEGQDPKRTAYEIIVNVRDDGEIVVNGVELTQGQLLTKCVSVAELNKDVAIILRADEDTTYLSVIEVLDVFRKANIWNVSFATSRPTAPSSP